MSRDLSEREERIRSYEQFSGRGERDENWRDTDASYRDRPRQRARYQQSRNHEGRHRQEGLQTREQQYENDKPPPPKVKPNFKPSGLLAKESNNIKGTQLKYTEPKDACSAPSSPDYYLFVFKKGSKIPREYKLNNKGYHLMGRDEKVVDLETDHDSCSKQHSVIQFRLVPVSDSMGKTSHQVKPYIIDLESSNGTFLNGVELPTSRFIELQAEDTIRFGDSETDHVLVIG